MRKALIFCTLLFLFSSSLSASTSSVICSSEYDFFCDAGWAVVDAYYDNGGNDGFVAAQLYALACENPK